MWTVYQWFSSENGTLLRFFVLGSLAFIMASISSAEGADESFPDVSSYVDQLQHQNQNSIHVSPSDASLPIPYERTGPGIALDGGAKFDLTQFNQAYFDWLRSVVLEAHRRGSSVTVTLFRGPSSERANAVWLSDPFNSENNINGIDNDPNKKGRDEEAYSLRLPAITALQQEYIRKVVDTLNDLDVSYQTAEANLLETQAWQLQMAQYREAYQASAANQDLGTRPHAANSDGARTALRNLSSGSLSGSLITDGGHAGGSKEVTQTERRSTDRRRVSKNSGGSGASSLVMPTISPNGGSYTDSVLVTVTSTHGASIYYTTDGSSPTQLSTRYEGPITIATTTLIKAKAFQDGLNPSAETSAWFTKNEGPSTTPPSLTPDSPTEVPPPRGPTPEPPTLPPAGGGVLNLAWTDNSGDENGFTIERKNGTTGTFVQIATVGADISSYADSGLTIGNTYCYRVNAFNAAGNSAYSNEACATANSQ